MTQCAHDMIEKQLPVEIISMVLIDWLEMAEWHAIRHVSKEMKTASTAAEIAMCKAEQTL